LDITLRAIRHCNVSAHWTLVPEPLLRKRLVYDRGHCRVRMVAFINLAAGQNRNLHRGEKLRADIHDEASLRLRAGTSHHRHRSTLPQERQLRKARASNPWNRREPHPQVFVKRGDLRRAMARLARIDCKRQHVLAVESEWNGLQIGKRTR